MRRGARVLVLLLAMLVAAAPVRALDPPDYETMLLGMDARLATLQTGNRGLQQLGQAMWAYMEARVPQADQSARDTFLSNLESRLNTMSDADLNNLEARAERQNGAKRQDQRFESAFNDKLDAIAFYTVASDEAINDITRRVADIERTGEKPQDPLGLTWSRGSAGAYRTADASTDWDAVDTQYLEFKRLDGMEWGSKKSFTKVTGSNLSEDRWVEEFEKRLLRLYSDPDAPLSPSLARDLARAQYLMLTPKPAPHSHELVVTDYLAGLAEELGDFAITPDQLSQMSPQQQREFARQASADIESKLRDREQDFGFRSDRLIPDGPLSEADFLTLIAAGYVADDVGAGIEHGAATHRLQWYALTEYFEQSEGGWQRTPADLYTSLGEFDLAREQVSSAHRFEFERNKSIWAHLFDQQGGRGDAVTDISRPDFLRPILNGRPDLAPLADRIEVIYRERQASGERLRDAFKNGERLPFALTPEERARMDALDAREATATADELYMLSHYSAALQSGEYDRVIARDGSLKPLLIERGATFETTRDEREIIDVRRQWSDKITDQEPPRPVADRPVRIAEHEAASTTDYRRRRGAESSSSRSRRDQRIDGEPEEPHGGQRVAAVDPTHQQARLVGEEEDPDADVGRGSEDRTNDRDDEASDRREEGRVEGRP